MIKTFEYNISSPNVLDFSIPSGGDSVGALSTIYNFQAHGSNFSSSDRSVSGAAPIFFYHGGDDTVEVNSGDASARWREICDSAIKKFIEISRSEYFEYGSTSPSERYLIDFSEAYPRLVGDVVQGIYLLESGDVQVTVALLNAVASLSYEFVKPYGQILALAALSNSALEVKEAAIRVFEAWGNSEAIKILKDIDCPWDWLDAYRKQVIADLGGGL